MGAGEIRLAYSRSKNNAAVSAKTNKYAIGYVHNLSKRTALYTTFAPVQHRAIQDETLSIHSKERIRAAEAEFRHADRKSVV